jgi:hypothetical protein
MMTTLNLTKEKKQHKFSLLYLIFKYKEIEMPRAENTASVKKMRSVALMQLREVLDSIEIEANKKSTLRVQVNHIKGLLELYLGTLPPTYRGE